MQNVETIKRKLELPPGDWQLISYGRLEEQPTSKAAIWIIAIFRSVKVENGQIVEWLSTIVERYLPSAEMIVFDIGCIFSAETSKVLSARPLCSEMRRTEVEVEFTEENCSLIRRFWRNDEGRLLFNNPIFQLSENSNAYLLSAVCTNGEKILIPCTTVLQAFWGRSSNLLSMLLDTRFLDFNHYVVNVDQSKFDESTGNAALLLRQWSLDSDARFLATIAFDETAVMRGQSIALRLCAMLPDYQNVDDRYIAAYPPHSTKVALEVLGLPVKSEKFGDYLFIQSIITSSYQPKFKSLTYDRDNDGRPSPQTVPMTGADVGKDKKKPINRPRKPSPPRREGKSDFELTSDSPSHDATSEPTQRGGFDQMFPNISNVKTQKAPQLETEYFNDEEGRREAKFKQWVTLLSTLPGTARTSSSAIHTTLESAKYVRDYSLDTNTSDIKIYLSNLIDAYVDYKKSRDDSIESMHIVRPRFPWPKSPAAGGALVFSLPETIQERNIAWLYSDAERTMRKRAICLEVRFLSENLETIGIGYIIDIEVRYPKPKISKSVDDTGKPKTIQTIGSTSMVLAWRAGQTLQNDGEDNKISDYDFRVILKAIAANGGYKSAKEHFPQDCFTQARKHSANGISFAKLLEELKACVLGGQSVTG